MCVHVYKGFYVIDERPKYKPSSMLEKHGRAKWNYARVILLSGPRVHYAIFLHQSDVKVYKNCQHHTSDEQNTKPLSKIDKKRTIFAHQS